MTAVRRTWRLLDAAGRGYDSGTAGTLGGHRRSRVYGRLDCPSARRALARGGYVAERVFFADEATAIAAGYRPCAVCLPERYATWKRMRDLTPATRPASAR
jgi:methylphosphotriester-DNA--protein-cysteine methyltransferase